MGSFAEVSKLNVKKGFVKRSKRNNFKKKKENIIWSTQRRGRLIPGFIDRTSDMKADFTLDKQSEQIQENRC